MTRKKNRTHKQNVLYASVVSIFIGCILALAADVCVWIISAANRYGERINADVKPDILKFSLILIFIGLFGLVYCWSISSIFDQLFINLGLGVETIYPILKSKFKGKYSTTYKFTLPPGLSTEDFIKKQQAIEEHIGKRIKIEYINKGMFIIEVFEKARIKFYDYEPQDFKGNVPIFIGKDRKGRLVCFDLAEGTEPHLLIAGTTGCGKSTALRSIITNLILKTNINLHLIDLKNGAEFSVFKRSYRVKSFAGTIDEAEIILKNINDEIEKRYSLFAKYEVNDIKAYNKRFKKNPLPYETLIVDEMVDFLQRKDLFFELESMSAKSRACGIHIILSTQRPDKDILTGRIKANVTNVLGLKSKDALNSRMIIDQEGLEKLLGKGHGLLSRLGEITEVQTPFLDADTVRNLIKHTYIDKPTKRPAVNDEPIKFNIEDLAVFQE